MSHQNDVGYLLHHLSTALDRQSDQVLQERLDIGFSQFKLLMVVNDHGGVSQRYIADYLGQTEASISRQVKLMVDRGLLASRVSEQNRRQHIVTITARGRRLLDEANYALNLYHLPVFSRLGAGRQAELAEMLELMHAETCGSDRPGSCRHAY